MFYIHILKKNCELYQNNLTEFNKSLKCIISWCIAFLLLLLLSNQIKSFSEQIIITFLGHFIWITDIS